MFNKADWVPQSVLRGNPDDECEAQPQPHNKPWIAAPSISGNTVIIIPSSSIGPRSLGAPSFQSSSAPSQSAAPPSLPSSLDPASR
eukprot:scaffold10698_cov213-Skeletonema_marinoi.AAC.13